MKRILPLMLALFVTAGCGQSQETTTDIASAAPAATATATAPTATQAAPTPAAATTTTIVSETRAVDVGATAAVAADRIELAQADLSTVEAAGFVEGRNFRRLSPVQPTGTTPGSVEVAEFFMYSCPHCYNLEPYVEAWLESKPAYINFVRIPTTWDEVRALHAQAFYAAEALGKVEEMHMPIFQEMHIANNFLQTPAAMVEFFGRFDVGREDLESVMNSFAVHTKLNRADELGRRYRIDSTPSFVINGKYRTGVDEAGGTPEALFALIEALAAAELGL